MSALKSFLRKISQELRRGPQDAGQFHCSILRKRQVTCIQNKSDNQKSQAFCNVTQKFATKMFANKTQNYFLSNSIIPITTTIKSHWTALYFSANQ